MDYTLSGNRTRRLAHPRAPPTAIKIGSKRCHLQRMRRRTDIFCQTAVYSLAGLSIPIDYYLYYKLSRKQQLYPI